MPQMCCVPQCRSVSRKGCGISFFTFPTDVSIRALWARQIQIGYDAGNKTRRVCSRHFKQSDYVFGANVRKLKKIAVPSMYIPNPVHVKVKPNIASTTYVHVPTVKKENMAIDEDKNVVITVKEENIQISENVFNNKVSSVAPEQSTSKNSLQEQSVEKKDNNWYNVFALRTIQILKQEVEDLKKENLRLKELSLLKPIFMLTNFMNNDKKVFYYTGFQTYSSLLAVFKFILPSGDINDLNLFDSLPEEEIKKHSSQLLAKHQFFLMLIRLRRGMPFEILGDLFDISTATAEKLFLAWIDVLYLRLGSLNIWPHRDKLIEEASTAASQEMYPNLIGSIVCIEFYLQKPSSLVQESQCYSNYEENSTLKSLIMISPNGGIIYSSPLFSRSKSFKSIINKSGLIGIIKEKLEKGTIFPRDIILADKGFNVVELFSNINLELNIPVFKIAGKQFIKKVQTNHNIAHERAIGGLKTYKMLSTAIPISSLGTIEKIYHVCCWLGNFRFPLE